MNEGYRPLEKPLTGEYQHKGVDGRNRGEQCFLPNLGSLICTKSGLILFHGEKHILFALCSLAATPDLNQIRMGS